MGGGLVDVGGGLVEVNVDGRLVPVEVNVDCRLVEVDVDGRFVNMDGRFVEVDVDGRLVEVDEDVDVTGGLLIEAAPTMDIIVMPCPDIKNKLIMYRPMLTHTHTHAWIMHTHF